ncbi:MAG: L-2-hydroxyglutarate oxidase [Gammaproteobacteria bacterium]|nr:L-2-hydroxyglutarate oxidase [Gammaproteobacteria bacterium]
MINAKTYDYAIVGSGIVGLTVASELKKRYPSASIVIVDKESHEGVHASGRNSGVLHSGVYYGADTLKAKVCSKGAKSLMEFAEEHSIAFNKSGKLIVATSEKELPTLDRLLNNANQNNIRAQKVNAEEIKEIEPNAAGLSAIYSPDTGVIDSKGVVSKLRSLLEDDGVDFLWNNAFSHKLDDSSFVTKAGNQISYGYLFNCAGSYADTVAKDFGLAEKYMLIPFKGIYWKLTQSANPLVKANIYPVPDIELPFLGVHLTRVISGDVYVGPTAIPALGRENYGILKGIRLGESIQIGYRLSGMYLKNQNNFRKLAHMELSKYSKHNFLNAAQKLMPILKDSDLVSTNKVGIRPQLINVESGALEMDYILEHTPNSTHVLNAISPAFTSSFEFARFIVDSSPLLRD